MGYGIRVAVITILALLMGTGSASAVGFERYDSMGQRIERNNATHHTRQDRPGPVQKTPFLHEWPGIIDDAASLVKDILSQFGLADKKAP
jgi:hypothetical protein